MVGGRRKECDEDVDEDGGREAKGLLWLRSRTGGGRARRRNEEKVKRSKNPNWATRPTVKTESLTTKRTSANLLASLPASLS